MVDRNKKAVENLKQKNQKKILIYGDSCFSTTGFGKVIKNMADALRESGHMVYTIGKRYEGPQIVWEQIPVFPSGYCSNCKKTNINYVLDVINSIQPDIFICVGDPYALQQEMLGKLEIQKTNMIFLAYTTVDSEIKLTNELQAMKGNPELINKVDKIISMAKFTQEQIKYWEGLDSDLLYATLDNKKTYVPINNFEKSKLRQKFKLKDDDFVMYYCGRAIGRKGHNYLIDACTKLITETDNTYLILNIASLKDTNGNQLFDDFVNPVDFIRRVMKKHYGRDLIEEKRIIFLNRESLGKNTISEEDQANMYKMSDVYVSTTRGEGFGLPPVESMACGVPVIIPDNSTGPELIGNVISDEKYFKICTNGLLIKTPYHLWCPDFNSRQKIVSVENTYKTISWGYNNRDSLKRMGDLAIKYVDKNFGYNKFKENLNNIILNSKKKGSSFKKTKMNI